MGSKSYAWLKPGIWGAVIGAVVIIILGFSQFGWMLGSKAEELATQRANRAVAVAMASVCSDKFFAQADSAANLEALKKLRMDYAQNEFIEKGGWAVQKSGGSPNYQLVSECVKSILAAQPA